MQQCFSLLKKEKNLFCNSELNKLKSGIKIGSDVILKISSNLVGVSNDENNFPHKLLLTNTQN